MKNDEQLQSDVEQELRWEPSVCAEKIGVSVKGGVVELDGHVDSYYEKWGAESAAMRVSNAKAVASEIRVELPSSATRTDQDIARTALDHLEWNYLVPNTVKVQVTDGWLICGNAKCRRRSTSRPHATSRQLKPLVWVSN